MLPLATATYSEMPAKGLCTVGRMCDQPDGFPFEVGFMLPCDQYIDYIARQRLINKNDQSVMPGHAASFIGNIFNQ
jgi:hypothetical protein